jgi:uncharacterized protein (TIGR02145 family)
MAENLNYAVAGSKCGNGSSLSDANTTTCDTYGRLYNWATAMVLDASCNSSSCAYQVGSNHRGICPEGWHIPSNDDWNKLVNYIESSNSCSDCAASYLKATSGWNEGGNGTVNYGFSALPGGFGSSGSFGGVGDYGYWWSASESSSDHTYRRRMNYGDEYVIWDSVDKGRMFSVRCLQD